MHKATITYRDRFTGEDTLIITESDLNLFHAKIVGAMQGLTYGGVAVVVSVTTEKEEVAA